MDATLFMNLPPWLDKTLRDQAERGAMRRLRYIRALLVGELGPQ